MKKSRIIKITALAVAVVTAVIIVVFILNRQGENGESKGILPLTEKSDAMFDEFEAIIYKDITDTMINDRAVDVSDRVVQEYIIANRVALMGLECINVKVFDDKTGQMTIKFFKYITAERKDGGEMRYSKVVRLNEQQTEDIAKIFETNSFWQIPTEHPQEGLWADGHTIYVEGIKNGQYNVISMQCPDKEYEIRRIYDGVVEMAEKLAKPDYREEYRFSEIIH